MNEKVIYSVLGLLLVVVAIFLMSQNSPVYEILPEDYVDAHNLVSQTVIPDLSQDEIDGLILMREEEKLARDVYLVLGEKWGMKIFSNIAQSEQTHTDAIKFLIQRYNLSDPVTNDSVGIFNSLELAELYSALINQGNNSLVDALTVGAIVEDLDIKDLAELKERTDNEDIIITYDNLQRGSRNHLRAYVSQLNRNNEDYFPRYISLEEYESIVSTNQERGINA